MGRQRRDRHSLCARRNDRPAGGHRVGGGAEGRRHDEPIASDPGVQDAVDVDGDDGLPGPSRITTRSLMATALYAPSQPTSSPGTPIGAHRPAAICSSADATLSAFTDINTPMLPQATRERGVSSGRPRATRRGRSRLRRARRAGRRPRPRPGPPPGASARGRRSGRPSPPVGTPSPRSPRAPPPRDGSGGRPSPAGGWPASGAAVPVHVVRHVAFLPGGRSSRITYQPRASQAGRSGRGIASSIVRAARKPRTAHAARKRLIAGSCRIGPRDAVA